MQRQPFPFRELATSGILLNGRWSLFTGDFPIFIHGCSSVVPITVYPSWWFGCHQFYFPTYWECPHPNWLIFFRGVGIQPPTRVPMIWRFPNMRVPSNHPRSTFHGSCRNDADDQPRWSTPRLHFRCFAQVLGVHFAQDEWDILNMLYIMFMYM